MLKFRVVGQRLIWENPDEVIVADTKKYLECYFEFDGDAWRGYKLIDAYFKKGRDNPIRMVLSSNRIWREDELCLSAGEWSLYLCATEYATRTNTDGTTESIVDRQITSSAVTIKVLASGQMTNAENSFKSPEIADQYIAKMSVLENARVSAENARANAESARVSAEASRTSAEAKRVSAENARVQEMQELSKKVEEALSGAGGSSGGFRKIGFTEDCDYIATEGDGLTAFRAALEAAVDGDTILVMSGVYEGAERFDVTKNVDFIGIGRPEIDFPIWISGGGVIEDWAIVSVYPSITSKWTGFDLWGGFEVGCDYDPSGNGGEGCGIIEDCEVIGNLKLTGAATNCYIDVDSISTGHYYGSVGTDFKQCFLKVKQHFEMNGGSLRACEIYPSSDKTYEYYTNSINAAFSGCRIYTPGTTFLVYDPHGGNVNLGDTIVFANSTSGCEGGYLVTLTAN